MVTVCKLLCIILRSLTQVTHVDILTLVLQTEEPNIDVNVQTHSNDDFESMPVSKILTPFLHIVSHPCC